MSAPSKLMRNGQRKKKGIKAWKVRKPREEREKLERCRECPELLKALKYIVEASAGVHPSLKGNSSDTDLGKAYVFAQRTIDKAEGS